MKLQVKNAVVEYLQTALTDIADVEQAKEYVRSNLPKIQSIANEALLRLGMEPDAVVTFCAEEFGKRIYETFSLPAGIYDSLRIKPIHRLIQHQKIRISCQCYSNPQPLAHSE